MKSTKHKRRGNLARSHQMLTSIIMKAKNQGVNPWKPSPLGQTGFDPLGMTVCIALKTIQQLSYDELGDYLEDSSRLLSIPGLKRVPSRLALQVASTRIYEHFITWMINSAGRPGMKGTLYGDSTGIAINGHNTWLYAKNGSRSRRDYRKLHIVTAENGIIIS